MDIVKTPPQIIPYQPALPSIYSGALARVAGLYYGIYGGACNGTTTTLTADRMYSLPFMVMAEETFDRICIHVSTASGAGTKARLGIYYNDAGKPGARLLDAGEVATDSTGSKEITISQVLPPGLYWLVVLAQSTPAVYGPIATVGLIGVGTIGTAGNGNAIYITTQAYGVLPDPHTTPVPGNNVSPGITLRRA